jgi:hypothetical protein
MVNLSHSGVLFGIFGTIQGSLDIFDGKITEGLKKTFVGQSLTNISSRCMYISDTFHSHLMKYSLATGVALGAVRGVISCAEGIRNKRAIQIIRGSALAALSLVSSAYIIALNSKVVEFVNEAFFFGMIGYYFTSRGIRDIKERHYLKGIGKMIYGAVTIASYGYYAYNVYFKRLIPQTIINIEQKPQAERIKEETNVGSVEQKPQAEGPKEETNKFITPDRELDILKEKFLKCPDAKRQWEEIKRTAPFSIKFREWRGFPDAASANCKTREIMLPYTPFVPHIDEIQLFNINFEMQNLKRCDMFQRVDACVLTQSKYAFSYEFIERMTWDASKLIAKNCTNGGFWPKAIYDIMVERDPLDLRYQRPGSHSYEEVHFNSYIQRWNSQMMTCPLESFIRNIHIYKGIERSFRTKAIYYD